MCTILLAYEMFPEHSLVVLANRDEYYSRPSQPAGFWEDHSNIYAGRDIVSGGTWMGVTTNGRFAAVTNYRDPTAWLGSRSRGHLVADFLLTDSSPNEYLKGITTNAHLYSPFNLLVGEFNPARRRLQYFSNRGKAPFELSPGIYGLSNHLLDSPWPKVVKGKAKVSEMIKDGSIDRERCFQILTDETIAEDLDLPSTGIPLASERALSAIFIKTPGYGTRCSSVLTFDNDGRWEFEERVFA